jgi:hypothetical protein
LPSSTTPPGARQAARLASAAALSGRYISTIQVQDGPVR